MVEVCAGIRATVPRAVLLDLVLGTAEESAAGRIVMETQRAFGGGIDVLVNSAGIRFHEPLAETWRRILTVNLLGHVSLSSEALPLLRASGHGGILNIASAHAVNPRTGIAAYITWLHADLAAAAQCSMADSLWPAGCHGRAGCGHAALYGVQADIRFMGSREATVGELEQRVRCSRCGERHVRVTA